MAVAVSSSPAGATFAVRVIPRAKRTVVDGMRGTALLVRLAAPPVDGAANEALVGFVADLLAVPRRSVSIVAGQASRDKRVEVAGLTPAAVVSRLAAILGAV